MPLNDQRTIDGWCFFDWANSAYSLVITATIFPVYYGAVTPDPAVFFGVPLEKAALYSYAISFSFLLIAVLSPVLSGIADYSGKKLAFMRFFTLLGSAACLTLFWFTGENVELGILASVVASIGYSGALVFYNAYLPEIVTPDRYDAVSARGFSFGYGGSVLLLVFNLGLILNYQALGFADNLWLTRAAFLSVALWWVAFAQLTFARLPKGGVARPITAGILAQGFRELAKVWRAVQQQPNTLRYLVAFFLYNTGVQTTIYLAALFGSEELKMEGGKLIGTILLLQIVAILGAYLFAKLSARRGNRYALVAILLVWIAVCFAAYFVYTETAFYLLAAGVGLVMGGVQSLSRATYTKLLPEGTTDTASYFSFYDVLDKCSTVLGTSVYGTIVALTGSMRGSTLALSAFFLAGLLVLLTVRVPQAPPRPSAGDL
jgi:UMF1 family MFS transporter